MSLGNNFYYCSTYTYALLTCFLTHNPCSARILLHTHPKIHTHVITHSWMCKSLKWKNILSFLANFDFPIICEVFYFKFLHKVKIISCVWKHFLFFFPHMYSLCTLVLLHIPLVLHIVYFVHTTDSKHLFFHIVECLKY